MKPSPFWGMTLKPTPTAKPLYAPSGEPWRPDKDQLKGVRFLLEHACAGLLADPGVGKTSITLAAFKWLKDRKMARRMLVIAPLRPAHSVWPGELTKWLDFRGMTYTVLHGDKKDALLREKTDVHIINLEGLEWLLGVTKTRTPKGRIRVELNMARVRALGYDILTMDELSKYKETSTVRFKMMRQFILGFGRRWGLTGSPAAKNLMGLFGECFVLDGGRTFGQYITHYQNKYFILGRDGFTWELQDKAEPKIYKAIKPLMLRLEAKGLPEAVVNDIWVDLPPTAMKIYKELEKDLFARIAKRTVVAANSGVASGKCRQVASGGVYLDSQIMGLARPPKSAREWVNLHNAKIDALEDLVDELQGDPLLVAYDYEHDLDRIRARFGKNVPYIGSGVSAKRGVAIERAWNAGEIPLLFGHPQSIGHGSNLQNAGKHVAHLTLTWDYELYDQFNRRVLRRGNRFPRCFIHRIVARGTIDEDVIHTLGSKQRGQNALFAAMLTRYQREKSKKALLAA